MLHTWLVTHHDVKDDAHAPDVIWSALVRDSLQDLGSRVSCAATERRTEVFLGHHASEAEVGHLHVVVAVQQDVLTLQVSVVKYSGQIYIYTEYLKLMQWCLQ